MIAENPVTRHKATFFEPGQTLGGRYQVIATLGRGGMGVVYHVIQMFLNKELALKTIEQRGLSEAMMRQFQAEARTAFAIKHPNVISVDDFGVLDDGTPFLVMELIHGETLTEKLKRRVSLSVEEAVPIFIQICHGLACAHKSGVVHRDIKPSNIMLVDDVQAGTEGSVKIVDFGIATFAENAADYQGGNTGAITQDHNGEIFGSPLYISPEQCSGGKVDHRSDIYSLGCVLFEALTGTPPFIGDNALTTMMKHKSTNAPSLKEASLGKSFPKELEQIVATMLAKAPDNRYQSMQEVIKDLTGVVRGDKIQKKVQAPKVTQESKAAQPLSLTRPVFVGAISLTVIASSLIAGIAAFEIKHLEMEKPIIEVIRDKTSAKFRAEDSVLPLDDETVEKLEIMPTEHLLSRLNHPDKDGRLALHFKTLDAEQMQLISKTPWVVWLDLEEAKVDNSSLNVLGQMPKMVYLGMKATNFNDEGAKALAMAKCKKLRIISAGGCSITDNGLKYLAENKNVINLDLDLTKITNEGLKFIGRMPNLLKVKLQNNPQITGEGLRYLLNSPLTEIQLNDNPNIDDQACEVLSKFPYLKRVVLTNTGVTLRGLQVLCTNRNLREVKIDRCTKLSKQDVDALLAEFPDITFRSAAEKPEVELDQ